MSDPIKLDLERLTEGMPGLSERMGAAMAEAAGVCLDSCGHQSPTKLAVDGDVSASYRLEWRPVDEQQRATWADEQFATEQGAYGVAILVAAETHGYVALERSRKGNGFDYWMGENDGTLFAEKARLEVSGIRVGDPGQITARVKQKTDQISISGGGLPGIVVVVEFSRPLARIIER